ncbi:hypothetical protein L9F63_022397, partial [Diploptera punctata]
MALLSCKSDDLTTLNGIENAYNKILTKEINAGLETLLTRQCHLEAKLRGITKVLPNLQIVHSDAQQLAEMITFTSTLAENVSAKVRQLDIARSRVSECQQRVHDLLDLQLCSEGVNAALCNEDYEKAAAHVHRFLSMDQSLLTQTADDMAQDCTSVTNSFSLLHEAAAQLGSVVTHKFDEAVRAEDLASVERFFKIFPLVGLHDLGLSKFSKYLCAKVQEAAQKNLRGALDTSQTDKRASVIYADTLTLLFEGIARIIEIHQPLIETYYGPGRLMQVVSELQTECDKESSRILAEFNRHRHVDSIVQLVQTDNRQLEPKQLDLLLGELTIMHSRSQLYVRFIRRRLMHDLETAAAPSEKRNRAAAELEGSELCRSMQELLSSYLLLEKYFMEESVRKAVAMDTIDETSHTSSMVDDIYFIVRKCVRRACTTGSVDGVCAVINNACTVLETDFCQVLKQQLKVGYPTGYLDLTQAYNVLHTGRPDSEQARITFL